MWPGPPSWLGGETHPAGAQSYGPAGWVGDMDELKEGQHAVAGQDLL